MLTVTDNACAYLAEMLDNAGVPEGTAARVIINEEGLGLSPDTPNDDDATFDHDGRTVLVLQQQLAEQLDERTLDTVDTEEGKGLALS
jgi:Fe-S cluster assembly iron-binding protein IscA